MRRRSILPNPSHARWRAWNAGQPCLVIGLAAAVASLMAFAVPAGAATTAKAHMASHSSAVFTTLEVRVPDFSGSAPVFAKVQAEPLNGARGLAARPILVNPTRVTGSWLRLQIPASAVTAALAKVNHGVANLLLTFTNGTQLSIYSVPTRATGTTTASVSDAAWRPNHGGASLTKVLKIRRPWALPAAAARDLTRAINSGGPLTPAFGCNDIGRVATDNNEPTRIGELHVASQSGVNGKYFYNTTADSNMTVGVGGTGSGWSVNGSVGVDNSIGSGGYTSHTDGWIRYVTDSMNYQKDKWVDQTNSVCNYSIYPYSSNGNASHGTNSPSGNPWGNCQSAPYHVAINPGGGWDGLNSTAKTQGWSFSAFNVFDGSGHTGYITTNRISYHNGNSSNNTSLCGGGGSAGSLPGSPVIYNDPS